MPAMEWLLSTPIAHRGLHDAALGIPENTLAAFEAARDAGFPIELDVRQLADGAPAVFHDEDLQRMTGTAGPVSAEDSRSIRARRVAGSEQTIPLLGQVLDLVAGKVPIVIELKNFGSAGGLESAVLASLDHYGGRFAVQSFNPHSMAWFKTHAPHIARGHLAGGFSGPSTDGEPAGSPVGLRSIDLSDPDFLGYNIRLLPHGPVASLRETGLPVVGWTVRTYEERRKALAHCDNYIFERIDPLRGDHET